MATRKGMGADRVLAKLRTSVDNGEYYEAHQMYRTLYFRYSGMEKWTELKTLLLDGARLLLAKGQTESGADLASLYIDVLAKSETFCDAQTVSNVASLFAAIDAESADRPSFLGRAVRWSQEVGPTAKGGHPDLHQAIGKVLWKEGDLAGARYHLIRSDDGQTCARLLVDLHTQRGAADEIDLFITQAVLQYLALKNSHAAAACFAGYLKWHPLVQADAPPFTLPLFNFLHYLLKAVESGEAGQFRALCDIYRPSLERDPTFAKLQARVGLVFFSIQPPQRQQGMLGNLIQSLMSGLEGGDDSDSDGDAASGTSTKSPVPKVAKMDTGELD
ncbi:Golgi to ER traffic protein 4 homolog [Pollicipes pollicipes]|uniref:Golgi to ER traffic protein 4 homolog n=1 Tax=Pollicipes pollicipes TaxID=41117 RepID=UPI00188515BC|nr:Golgi to ER traffic protein 4 homolog [Pollicipes pollicipes]XP_037074705.1 Golgi to ER traffic protein 4 homolog [Pollicipes pollicipes]XP_037074706.1 Golgi to ER traffic protein 4 homolog [Pollicipes pollicipes]XP_037074707.1 Golgi to ER traffic protein 4 homolog [Pollicipes pollicipes]